MTHLFLAFATLTPSANAQDLVGTTVTADYGSVGICDLTATVVDPGVEFVGAGPGFCMAGSSPRLDVDVTSTTVRWDFTAVQDFGFGSASASWLWLLDINPTCPSGGTGYVRGITNVTTSLGSTEWVPSQVAFTDHTLELIGFPSSLGGDGNLRTNIGDFIEVELDLACPISLEVSGSCPGQMSFDVYGVTPFGNVGVGVGPTLGSDVITAGPCAGLVTGLGGATPAYTFVDADGDGEIHLSPNVTTTYCGQYVQVIDRSTCTISNVEQF